MGMHTHGPWGAEAASTAALPLPLPSRARVALPLAFPLPFPLLFEFILVADDVDATLRAAAYSRTTLEAGPKSDAGAARWGCDSVVLLLNRPPMPRFHQRVSSCLHVSTANSPCADELDAEERRRQEAITHVVITAVDVAVDVAFDVSVGSLAA